MALKKRKTGGVNQLVIVISGIIILLGAVLTYLFVLKGVYGRFSSAALVPDTKMIKNVVFGTKPKIAILYSKYTENILPDGSTWLNDNISTWKKFIGNNNYKYDIINDETIEMGKHFDYKMIVLPGSKSLSDREIVELKKYIDAGGSVFATGGTASFSDDGKWRGWNFLSEVFGISFTKELKDSDYTKIHTLRGGLPITANIPAGYPLKVAAWDRPIAVEIMDPRTTQVSFWYNYRLENGLVRENIKKTAGIVYGNYGKGRFVWMGFELNSVIGVQEDYIYFDRLVHNEVSWLMYSPVSYLKNWPNDYSAAAVLTPILGNDINNVKNLLPILKNENVDATFFVNPQTAEKNKNLIRSLTPYGEIGAQIDIGYLSSINDTINKLNDLATQTLQLKNAKKNIERICRTPVEGLLPYYGLFNNNTIKALINADYNYVLTDSLTDRSVPKTIIRGDDRVSAMTKTARDDFEVIRDFNLNNPDFQFYTYQEDIDRVLFESGMYIFKMHTDYQCKKDYVKVVDEVIKDLKKKNYWITTMHDIQRWFGKRDRLELRTDKRGPTRVAVNISNPGNSKMNGLVIEVDLNDHADNVSVSTEIIGTKMPKVKHSNGSKIVLLYVDDLKANESRTYFIDYDKINI